MAAMTGLGAVNAQAATPANTSAPSAATIRLVPANASGAVKNADEQIVCKPSYSAPHLSGHAPGQIKSVGSVKCSHTMARIVIAIHLTSSNFTQKPESDTCPVNGKATASCQVNITCTPNTTFAGSVYMTLTAPPGFDPPSASWGKSASFKVTGFC
jgi:hypothetical protein